jgi:hypothetical protein
VVLIVLNSSEQADQEIMPCLTTFKFFKAFTISTPSSRSSFFWRHTPDGSDVLCSGYQPGFVFGKVYDRLLFRSFLMGAGRMLFVTGEALYDLKANDLGIYRIGTMFEALPNDPLVM